MPSAAASLGDMLKGAFDQGRNQAQNSTSRSLSNIFDPASWRCKTLLTWVRTPVPDAAPEEAAAPAAGDRRARMNALVQNRSAMDPKLAWLISDEVFSKHFEKNYEQLTQGDFREFQGKTARACQQGGEFTPAEWQLVQQIWNPSMQARLVQAKQAMAQQQAAAAAARAQAQSTLDGLTQQLQTDPGLTLERLASLREEGRRLGPTAGPEPAARFEDAWRAQLSQRGPELLRVAVETQTVQAGQDLAALSATRQRLQTQAQSLGLDPNSAQPAWSRLLQQEQSAATVLADTARSALNSLPDGLPGLEAGVQWHASHAARWSRLADQQPALTQVLNDFRQRRQSVLNHAGPGLVGSVQGATTVAQAQGLIGRYTLPDEGNQPAVRAMREAIDERIRLIERNAALGHATAPGRSQPTREAPGDTATAAAAAPAAPSSRARGEPSEEVMYELVRTKFEKAAARIRGLYDQCQNGGNPGQGLNMVMCMGLNLQNSLTGGAAASPTRITRFRKIGCAPAGNRPGYNCEFKIETDSAIDQQFQQMTGFAIERSGHGEARFVSDPDGGWLMISQ